MREINVGLISENMSSIKMLTPAASRDGVIEAVVDIVKTASSNPCPPITVGVGKYRLSRYATRANVYINFVIKDKE